MLLLPACDPNSRRHFCRSLTSCTELHAIYRSHNATSHTFRHCSYLKSLRRYSGDSLAVAPTKKHIRLQAAEMSTVTSPKGVAHRMLISFCLLPSWHISRMDQLEIAVGLHACQLCFGALSCQGHMFTCKSQVCNDSVSFRCVCNACINTSSHSILLCS